MRDQTIQELKDTSLSTHYWSPCAYIFINLTKYNKKQKLITYYSNRQPVDISIRGSYWRTAILWAGRCWAIKRGWYPRTRVLSLYRYFVLVRVSLAIVFAVCFEACLRWVFGCLLLACIRLLRFSRFCLRFLSGLPAQWNLRVGIHSDSRSWSHRS